MSEIDERLQLAATYGKVFAMHDDEERIRKTNLFAKKLIDQEYMIGFAGHFSAGKSSMINALTGEDLLPSSPIPTSANIVKVKKDDHDYAIIHRTDGTAVKYDGHGFPGAIKSFSKDGAAVSLVEIGHTASNLPEGITVMDTPGVDSTDDAHRLSTESALHLADLVFYTMDYNHVQSELNFRFTKELMRYNESVYLIINQIDKHRESELPFEAFKQSVENSFALWGVEPKGIFYTSLKELEHPHNDFNKVKAIVQHSMDNWQERFLENIDGTFAKLKDEHIQFLTDEMEERKNTFAEIVSEEEWSEREELQAEASELKKKLTLLSSDAFATAFEENRSHLLQNAAITPYETRELLKDYLESLSSRFKVGFLFSGKKTEEEKARRKEALAENLDKLIHTQIEVHLKVLMKQSLREAGILTDERSLAIDALDLSVPFADLEKEFNVSDVITGDTVLNYAERMKTVIQTGFKRLTDDWKHEMSTVASTAGNEQTGELEQKIHRLDEKLSAIEQVNVIEDQLEVLDREIMHPTSEIKAGSALLLKQWTARTTIRAADYAEEVNSTPLEEDKTINDQQVEYVAETSFSDADAVIADATRVAKAVEKIPGFLESANYLQRKSNRLEGQEFTVALFGAFSAGKSSFSNALIGEKVLPVSPNPTTAAINRIRPITKTKRNNTADVHLKSKETMTEDVIRSFDALGMPVSTLEVAFDKAQEAVQLELDDESLHIHKSFIDAFQKGYPVYKEALGTILNVERDEFVKFVAEEDRSCFVESIDFYYDCPLTQKGITLVDTPGADSINARHTDVAFDYIRNADAILFVTYYNHAFARADREFLIQLGRVKDAFEMDKMFFIVNAIDLAANEEEAEAVQTFVKEELQKFGIRHPRVHGISSLEALEAKLENRQDPFMAPFEQEFHHFLEKDLKGLAVQALEEETMKTIGRLSALIIRTEANRTRKAERLQELDRWEGELRQHFGAKFANVLMKAAHHELGELVYYILQRVFLRYGDFFKEAYNPSVFVNHSADRALTMALAETTQLIGFDLTQELKVTNLRMLNFMKKQIQERERNEMSYLKDKDGSIAFSPYEPQDVDLLTFEAPYKDPSKYSSVNKVFKNQKAFFEKGERDVLKDRLEELLKEEASIYLGIEKEKLEKWTDQWIDQEAEGLRQHLLSESLQQIASERTLLQGSEQLEEWREIYTSIKDLNKELV
ncbi:dynamin family protein [Sporosarcina sp. HYO08]|uniref:dynamin family protein n=1 Tax=Sporosarcina sp. HYO08 TaxID=1759557 RepID=UPI00079B9CF9|nr:dynamin family protein [Sporosarcina sp. HYO08]KXH81971.1 GTPase [Sporosarcina sp. HYO08]